MTEAEKINEIWRVLQPFTSGMRERMTLKKNLNKVSWNEMSLGWLEDSLQHQVNQLSQAILDGMWAGGIREKAIDVANVAMLVADKYHRNH